ncbi:VOC family protein [Salinibaculum salinum]|uniref:VOC family protein n=1 Tax=Salinibaculum salinum TaxID=3131996 RepID=UPI0030EF2249
MDVIHVCLNVSDADRIAQWYIDELGYEETWGFTTADGKTRNVYVADGNGLELQLSDTEGQDDLEPGTAYDHFAVKVDNVDEAFEDIENHGVVKEPGDQPAAGARTAMIKDPDGHIVELVEPVE